MHSLFIFNHWLKFIFFKKKIEILKLQDLLLMLEYALTLENLLDKIKVVSDLTIFDISREMSCIFYSTISVWQL